MARMEFRYASGELVDLGDRGRIDAGAVGVIVGVIHNGQYSGAHKKEHWDHYGSGVLVESATVGLVFYEAPRDFAVLQKIT